MNAQKADWNDINVAYHVAKHGTLTAAAEALDVHHSTVLRRISALEQKLETKLFHRHARGYVPTEAGKMLTLVAENTQNQFDRLVGQLQGVDAQPAGTLIVTTVNSLIPNLMPLAAEFRQQFPEIRLEFAAERRIFRLEHGEAHISIRPGIKPQDPDYVVQHLGRYAATLYASAEYIAKNGLLTDIEDLKQVQLHKFIATIDPFNQVKHMAWLNKNVLTEQVYVRVNDFLGMIPAVKAGLGIAPIGCWLASTERELRPLIQPPESWHHDLWLVTHVDMHRTSKVQAFNQFIKQKFQQVADEMLGNNISL